MNRINYLLSFVLIFLLIIGFLGRAIYPLLTSSSTIDFYPEFLASFLGVVLGIPAGLFVNRKIEEERTNKTLVSLFTFLLTELESNLRVIENLQESAEKLSESNSVSAEDLGALRIFSNGLTTQSFVAAQSSEAFTRLEDDHLMSSIINAYLNIQRILQGVLGLELIEPEGRKRVLLAYVKLCERAKGTIRLAKGEINSRLGKLEKRYKIE